MACWIAGACAAAGVQLGSGTRSCCSNVCARHELLLMCIVYSKALPLAHPPRKPRSLHSLMHAHYAYEPLLLRGSQQLSAASVGHSAARSAERSARPIYTGTVALSVPPDASHTLLNALAMHTVRSTDSIIRTRRWLERDPATFSRPPLFHTRPSAHQHYPSAAHHHDPP